MIAHARAVVRPGVLAEVASRPPLTLRQVRARPGTVGLCLVGSAAGPLAGDDLRLSLDVAAGARAELVAAGASIAQGGASRMAVDVHVGAGGRLDADPGALVVSAGARVDLDVSVALASTAVLTWRELVVLGRTGETAGQAVLAWNVTRGGAPLLRQHVDLADPSLTGWYGMTAGCRVLLTELRIGPAVDARTVVHTDTAVTQRLGEGAALTTVLAPSAAAAHSALGRLSTQDSRPFWTPPVAGLTHPLQVSRNVGGHGYDRDTEDTKGVAQR